MTEARAEILGAIRAALRDVPASERATADRGAGPAPGPPPDASALRSRAGLLRDRIRDYAADAELVPAGELPRAIGSACARRGLERLLLAPGVPEDWIPGGVAALRDDGRGAAELDAVGAVLTGCALAIASTGTVVLDGGPASGRRALTLVPDHHLCVVDAARIVPGVPEAIGALHDAVADRRAPLTFVSGASATSDIELSRVEGVHGPRDLLVLIALPAGE